MCVLFLVLFHREDMYICSVFYVTFLSFLCMCFRFEVLSHLLLILFECFLISFSASFCFKLKEHLILICLWMFIACLCIWIYFIICFALLCSLSLSLCLSIIVMFLLLSYIGIFSFSIQFIAALSILSPTRFHCLCYVSVLLGLLKLC